MPLRRAARPLLLLSVEPHPPLWRGPFLFRLRAGPLARALYSFFVKYYVAGVTACAVKG